MTAFRPVKDLFARKWLRWLAVLCYAALVYYICLLPSSNLPKNNFLDKIYFDKWVHIMMYFGMWSLVVWAMKGPGKLVVDRKRMFIISFVTCLFMGASIEFLQARIGRGMDWTDELANLAGMLLAWRFWLKFEHRWGVYGW